MNLPSAYVLWTSAFVYLAVYTAGMSVGAFNGILEMEGFQETFRELYGEDGNEAELANSNSSTSASNQNCSSGNGLDSDVLIGLFVSLLNVSQIFGFIASGWIADAFSRKYSLIIGGGFMVVGCAVLASSFYLWMLYIGRLITGISIGILYMMTALYVAEVCPREVRGMMTSITGPSFNAGLMTALFTNVGFAQFRVGWRVALLVVSSCALCFCIGMKFFPHTPRWLVKKGRHKEALLVLTKVNKHSAMFVDAMFELEEIRQSVGATAMLKWQSVVKEVYRLKYRLFLVIMLFGFGSSSGLFILYYSTTLFCVVGVPPFTAGVALGFVLLLGGFVPTVLADKVGRKPILLFSSALNCAAGTVAGVLLHVFPSDSRTDLVAYMVVFLIYVYAFGYSASWLSIPWVIGAEIFPNTVRGLTFGISCVSYGLFGLILNQVTPIIVGSPVLKLYGFLYVVSMETLIALLFVFVAMPETKGVSLEDMDKLFHQSVWQNIKQSFIGCKLPAHHHTQHGAPEKCDLYDMKMDSDGIHKELRVAESDF